MNRLALFLLAVPLFASALQPRDLTSADEPHKYLLFQNPANSKQLIRGVKSSQPIWLAVVPDIIDSLPQSQYLALMDALAASLIRSAPDTLHTLAGVDKVIAREGHSSQRDRFGSLAICEYVPDPHIYSKQSVKEYHSRARAVLPRAGEAGRLCLEMMDEVIAEMKRDNQKKPYKWGSKDYFKSYYPLTVPTEIP